MQVLEFSSTVNVVAWKVLFNTFWLSKKEYKSVSSEKLKVIYIKWFLSHGIITINIRLCRMHFQSSYSANELASERLLRRLI